ncbi:uncharacterized protein GGS25DRAFT_472742 [Hypoxylon fragiforme]|uniref:uncharacterized protein n=1 Tax=Hypoxylon fragiforme TaxID=63214 RepID=UPI0020C6EE7C|nr:uncharacterized protein GGS25DRAFT_472742 [Hypoxylon fragiforme]KAI2614697.1 hypothetical protein GGS25DRAFT_472742 [Hypoxylon fragiforme]
MGDSQASGTPSGSATRARGRQPRGGRSYRGRGSRGNQPPRDHQVAEGSQVPGGNASNSTPPSPAGPAPNANRGGRGRRGARGSRRGGNENSQRTTGGLRAFGGHLTTNGETEEPVPVPTNSTGLNVTAPNFTPGQPIVVSNSNPPTKQQAKSNARRKPSKSTAEDISTRIHEDINNAQYECVICTNEVLRNSKIWSCSICWTVTHTTCVKKWYSTRIDNAEQLPTNWRCPGCNSPLTDEPTTYHCWCGKEINPRSIPGLDPHSCGQTCSKPRGTCPHPCPLQCHAGPCPPCLQMGPTQHCFCGKHTSTKRCGETDYTHGWSCHDPCGDILPCGEHECQKECHSGLCGSCEIPVLSICYCGRQFKEIPCEQRGDKFISHNYGQVKVEGDILQSDDLSEREYWGSFECNSICGRLFDCGKHRCEKSCHPQDENEAHCPFSPDAVPFCPCGKTPLEEIITQPRQSCEDPIPNCKKICNKPFPCGHFCQDTCHSGSCSPCTQKMEISCRCGRTKTNSVCHQGIIHVPECMKICRAQLNCGRHEHGERCCSGEKKAMERVAAKRKNRNSSYANDEIEAEHICTRTCGRDLKCKRHQCQQLCHKGPCRSCPEAIFEEISCNCGRTILQPPQPCGTRPPECRSNCTRPRPCGHSQVLHNCHLDEEPCPKCPFLVEKQCVCGKKMLKNQPCWFETPHCGLPCGRKLKCGTHTCGKTCHPRGECEDAGMAGSRCKQRCGKIRACGHADVEQCHAPYPCKEDKPCQAKAIVTCECQRKKQEVRCMFTSANPSPQRKTLKCDDECLRLQRNARLAEALNIDPQAHTNDQIPYSSTTLELYRDNPEFAQQRERECRLFAADPTQKLLRFKPMRSHQRAFLHSLAEDYGFDSESADPEPHRHVCFFKTPRFISAPTKTLSQCISTRAQAQPTQSMQSVPSSGDGALVKPYNALLLTTPLFGLTVDELDSHFAQEYAAYPDVKFQTSFLPSDEVVIKGIGTWRVQTLEANLTSLKPAISQKVQKLGLAASVSLCHVDESLNVLRRETTQSDGGWNAVVGRSAARPKPSGTSTGQQSAPLRSKFVALRKEPKKVVKLVSEDVADDWEAAAEELDEVEKKPDE